MRLVSEISRNRICVLIFIRRAGLAAGQTHHGPAHIDVYVTPFYNSKGPVIEVRPFSNGLAAKNESEFVAPIKPKSEWDWEIEYHLKE